MAELSKRLERSLGRIERGGGIVLVNHTPEGGNRGLTYQLPNGREVSPGVVFALLASGHLSAGGDGLFGGGDEQTLHVSRP